MKDDADLQTKVLLAALGICEFQVEQLPHGYEGNTKGTWGAAADCLRNCLAALSLPPQGGSRAAGPLLDDMPDATQYDGGMGSGKWLGAEMP